MPFALPGKHSKHALWPGDGWKAPCEQGVQTCWPGVGEYVPVEGSNEAKLNTPSKRTSEADVASDRLSGRRESTRITFEAG